MNSDMLTPWLKEVVFLDGVEWRRTIGYSSTYVNRFGEVGRLYSRVGFQLLRQHEAKTTNGTYLNVFLRRMRDQRTVSVGVHQLVATAFVEGPPSDGKTYEPNHKDGNKHNNRAENLEWVTRSQNVLHAYRTGLSKNGVRMTATDVLTGEVIKTNTLSDMARVFKITRPTLTHLAANHRTVPWGGRWVFSFDPSSDDKVNRHQRRAIMMKDYETGEVTICADSIRAQLLTGVRACTIRLRVREQAKNPQKPMVLLSKYVFQNLTSKPNWPSFSESQVREAKKAYENKMNRKETPTPPVLETVEILPDLGVAKRSLL